MTDEIKPLPRSTEEKAMELARLGQERDRLAEQYEALRDELVQELDEAQFFIDPETGQKKVAYKVAPERTVIDADLLASYVSEDVINDVTKRTVVTDKFWAAVKGERIPDEVAARVARLIPVTPHVRFGDPSDLARRAAE